MFWILDDVHWCPIFEIYWMELDGLRRWKTLCWQSWQTQVWWLQEAKRCGNERAEESSHCTTRGIGFYSHVISHGSFMLFPLPPLRQRAEKDWTFPIWCSDAWQNPDRKVLGQKHMVEKSENIVVSHCTSVQTTPEQLCAASKRGLEISWPLWTSRSHAFLCKLRCILVPRTPLYTLAMWFVRGLQVWRLRSWDDTI